jgi:hypothetical protein
MEIDAFAGASTVRVVLSKGPSISHRRARAVLLGFLALGAFLKYLVSHRRPSRRNGMQANDGNINGELAELAFSHKPPA